jgi:DNA-binding response OmpR family regulator
MELGADDYLTKPFENIDLLKAIEVKLERRAAMEKIYVKDEKNVALSKVLVAINILKKVEPEKRENCTEIIGNLCASELNLVSKMKDLENTFSLEELILFRQLNGKN